MLDRLLKLRPEVHAVSRLEDTLRPYTLIEDNWNLLEQLKQILSIFVKATETLSGSSYPTLSIQLPYYVVIAARLEKLIESFRQTDLSSHLIQALNQAWVKLNQYHLQTISA